MINVNVFSEEKAWTKRLKNYNLFFKKICKAFPKKYKFINKKISLTLLLSNNRNIKRLNRVFRKKNKSTDVLSFPFYNKVELLKLLKVKNKKEIFIGDIIINLQKIRNKSDKKNFLIELDKLWVHGLAHLFGHRHKIDRDFFKMNKIEKEFLKHLN